MTGDGNDIVTRPVDIITTEHVLTDQATTFSDAELIGDMAQVRFGKAGDLTPQPIDLFHDSLTALQFGVGQILGIGRINLTRYPLGRAPRQQDLSLADRMKKPA